MVYALAAVLTLLNVVFWFGILFGLPGAWLMVLLATLIEWWQPGEFLFPWSIVYVSLALAVLGELLEFLLGAAGARRSGGSRRAAALAILGGIVGAVFGTLLPAPIVGTLIGASLGAFAGSALGDLWAGRPAGLSIESGRGAAIGRFWGTLSKMAAGAAIVVIQAIAAFA